MPRARVSRKVPEGRIEKPEDKAWKEWFDKLSIKEHESYLAKLGLDEEDIKEWEEEFKKKKKG